MVWRQQFYRTLAQGVRAVQAHVRDYLKNPQGVWHRVISALDAERARWSLWIPAGLGAGIALYFAWPTEPALWVGLLFFAIAAVGRLQTRQAVLAALAGVACVVAAGFLLAQWRTQSVSAPIVERASYVTLTARVLSVEHQASGARRVLLEPTSIERRGRAWPSERLPRTVRVRIGKNSEAVAPGDWVTGRVRLMPPPPPAAPGGFDFARQSFFRGLGAVGYALGSLDKREPVRPLTIVERFQAGLAKLRHDIAGRLRTIAPDGTGAILAALLVGDRSGIAQEDIDALRDAGLAHLLAISGLHMAAVASILFFLVRLGLAAIEPIALNYPIKKWAAGAAIAGGFFYLLLSGASISTQRAFIMMALMMLAILMDRPALSMRTVAWAAVVVLVLAPESLLAAGFQMSFAAVIALIAVYESWPRREETPETRGLIRRAANWIGGILGTTVIASVAIGPFAAFHFQRAGHLGDLIANLLAVPLFGIGVIFPMLLSLLTMPFGLDVWVVGIAEVSVGTILAIAHETAGWSIAVQHVPAMPGTALLIMVLGGLWMALWTRPWRWWGIAGIAAGLVLAWTHPRPDILIEREGATAAVRDASGRLAAVPGRAGTYSLDRWLRRDGEDAEAPAARARGRDTWRCDALGCTVRLSDGRLVAFARTEAAQAEDCEFADILISKVPMRRTCPGPDVVIDRFDLWRNGAYALYADGPTIRVRHARAGRGERPWVLPRLREERSGDDAR